MRIVRLTQVFFLIIVCTNLLLSCKKTNGGFVKLSKNKTHIDFANIITESDSVNIFDFPNVYNGGGVGAGDFNNDGLQDLYFTGNMVPNKLYLNKGSMNFEDITTTSGTGGDGRWCRGVAVVDINNDGKQDIYVCATAKTNPSDRINLLYVNQGLDKNNIPVFKDMAAEYGLADTTQSTMAYFFDYDNDGDLDLYIGVNHIIIDEYANIYKKRNLNGEHPSTGKLYRNDWNESLKHPVYTDVSRQAGILIEGYTHAVDIFDINKDGWMDILVTNDYVSNNVLYINNQDGSFTDRVTEYFKHTAANSMGSDAVDINNDGLTDVIELDMAAQDNLRKKMFQSPSSYQNYVNSDIWGYQYQYVRNMLQVNQGPSMGELDTIKHPVFADAGYFAGIAETDWSWAPLVADFDADGNKDIIFTNGFPKDITDRDFMTYRNDAISLTSEKEMLDEIPEVKIHNYVYKNEGNLKFTDATFDWGFGEPNFSNGAAYADLDNDGDLDVIINNIKDPASVYENRINSNKEEKNNYIALKLNGSAQNLNGIGAIIDIYQKDRMQVFNNMPYRGYLSTQSLILNAGTGKEAIDSVIITWPDKKIQKLISVAPNQTLTINYKDAVSPVDAPPYLLATNNFFTNITGTTGIKYVHQQLDFIDFSIQKLLPHKFSEYAPGIATGDINGDGLDDFITGSSPGYSPMIFTQTKKSTFITSSLLKLSPGTPDTTAKKADDRGLLLFDADKDGDPDLYIASGGYAYNSNDAGYADQFYVNDGKGNFTLNNEAIPLNVTSKFCVRACDYDKDGDLDLFVAGRVDPHAYPKPVSSFIYRNDTDNGHILFTDVTTTVAPSLQNIGLACDALFSDYDNDGWPDLILAGEWMPITFLHNDKGKFVNVTAGSGINAQTGWWNSITSGDFDNDGDMDYVAGNTGLNSFYKASAERPVNIRAKDFDNNGSYDAIPSLYLPANTSKGAVWNEYPAFGRDDLIKQMIGTRAKFLNYHSFAVTTIDSIITPDKMKDAIKLSVTTMASSVFINDGKGHFTIHQLPAVAQLSALNGMVVDDFDGDGNLDIAINTNDFGTEPLVGRYDALNGLILKGNGDGSFNPLSILQSGLFISGNGKGFGKILSADSSCFLIASQNKGALQVYKNRRHAAIIKLLPDDAYSNLVFTNGKKQRQEYYYGSSFLSQSSRFFIVPQQLKKLTITNTSGKTREVTF